MDSPSIILNTEKLSQLDILKHNLLYYCPISSTYHYKARYKLKKVKKSSINVQMESNLKFSCILENELVLGLRWENDKRPHYCSPSGWSLKGMNINDKYPLDLLQLDDNKTSIGADWQLQQGFQRINIVCM